MKVKVNLNAFLRRAEAEGVYVSFCPELQIFSQGRTADEAKNALHSAISMWVKTCYKRSVLDRALHEAGFEKISLDPAAEPPPGTIVVLDDEQARYDEKFDIEVPLYLLTKRGAEEVHG